MEQFVKYKFEIEHFSRFLVDFPQIIVSFLQTILRPCGGLMIFILLWPSLRHVTFIKNIYCQKHSRKSGSKWSEMCDEKCGKKREKIAQNSLKYKPTGKEEI